MPSFRLSTVSVSVLLASLNTNAQNVVTDWNTLASSTIVTTAGQPIAASGVYFAYTSIAVYDAVNTVHEHQFQPFITSVPHTRRHRTKPLLWPPRIACWSTTFPLSSQTWTRNISAP